MATYIQAWRPVRLARAVYDTSPLLVSSLVALLVANLASTGYRDYRLYISLGGGGPLPHNLFGWLVHSLVLQPLALARFWRTSSRHYLPLADGGGRGYLKGQLGSRRGGRPKTAGVAPHRQVDQLDETGSEEALKAHLRQLAANHPSHLLISSSRIEPSSTALFSLTHTLVTRSDAPSRSTRSAAFPSDLSRLFLSSLPGAEFCHVHAPPDAPGKQDGSLHLVLSPEDADEVIGKGWGELHGLAGCPAYTGFWIVQRKVGLPPTYTLIYAPRDDDEVEAVKRIINASVAFATGLREVP
ncbi:uncharacterized protein PSFLO_02184 [Pseudozyma flocculosa]|uniref:Luciferase domain-containing protein n=1 Tax=Pseudozyma flocculosa TaxID=84751 RepID=A0A5C3EWS3_9BASI|nr:uncharacterized protein PSFLO_02184 [Pseudozyma flocculosa]